MLGLGSTFWIGLVIVLVLAVISSLYYLIIRPILMMYFNNSEIWYGLGFFIAICAGYLASSLFVPAFCMNVILPWLCSISVKFFVIVGVCLAYWALTRPLKREV